MSANVGQYCTKNGQKQKSSNTEFFVKLNFFEVLETFLDRFEHC